MKESLKLRKQQLEQNILEAEKTWNRLEKFFNIFIRGYGLQLHYYLFLPIHPLYL